MAYYSDDMISSSPDPLNDSGIYTSPEKTRRRMSSKSRPRTSLPMNGSSPNKQTFELAVGNGISPQKLFVTVEAANSDTDSRYPRSAGREIVFPSPYRTEASPSRTRERTRTTTIPLRGLSDTEDVDLQTPIRAATPKKARGRPRKSGTPIPKKSDGRRRTFGATDDEDDEDIWDIGAVGASKGKGRSRSISTTKKGPAKKAKATPKSSQENPVEGTAQKKGRGRPKKLRQDEEATLTNLDDDELEQDEVEVPHDVTPDAEEGDAHDFGTRGTDTTVGDEEEYQDRPDIVLARFDESLQTPNGKGWSSPHGVSSVKSSTKRKSPIGKDRWIEDEAETDLQEVGDEDDLEGSMDYRSDTENNNLEVGSPKNDSEEMNDQPFDDGQEFNDEDDYESEAGDNVGDMREFDTIMESEDFSMISVDSLREHLSSPLDNDEQTAPKPNSIGAFLMPPVKQGGDEDSFSTIAQSILDAASPAKAEAPLQAFRGQHLLQQEDSFSSIAPSILEAASPVKASRPNEQIESTPKAQSRVLFSSGLPSHMLEPRSVQSEFHKTPTRHVVTTHSTPRAGSQEISQPQIQTYETTAADTDMIDLTPTRHTDISPRPSSRRSSHWSGLATPRESESPILGAIRPSSAHTDTRSFANDMARNVEDQDTHMSSSPPQYVKSSPPQESIQELPQEAPQEMSQKPTFTAHVRQQRMANTDIVETPSIVFSSPTLPPLNQHLASVKTGQLAPITTASSSQRPPLSQITRAGQVLQDVVVAPSSPRARSQSLGSPFTSPFKSRGSSKTPTGEPISGRGQSQPINGRRSSILNLFTNFSDGLERDSHESPDQASRSQNLSSAWSVADALDDPFRNNAQSQHRSPFTTDKEQYSLEAPSETSVQYPSLKNSQIRDEDNQNQKSRQPTENLSLSTSLRSLNHSVRMRDASPLISVANEIGGNRRIDAPETHVERLEREWASERQVVSQQIDAAHTSQVIVLSSEFDDEDMEEPRDQDEDGEDDVDIWQDEARNSSSVIEETDDKQSFSDAKHLAKQPIVEKPRRGKIPSPWRQNSRRLVYSDELADMSSSAEPRNNDSSSQQTKESIEKPLSGKSTTTQESTQLDGDSEEFTGLWQMQLPRISQKANFKPKLRTDISRLDFSALLEPSPRKSLPTPVTSEAAGPSQESASQHRTQRYSSPLVNATISRLNVSPPKALQSSPFANTDDVEHEQDNYFSPHNENFGSDTDWPEDMSTPARSTTTSKSNQSFKKPLSPLKSIVQKSIQSVPQPKAKPESPFLSTTEWSKPHWRILDKIFQNAKPLAAKDVFNLGDLFVREKYFVGLEVERDGEGLVTSSILGKEVHVREEESMILEQWHLEIIGIFREVVGWDDEKVLAKRLFGLVGAEERRKNKGEARGVAEAKAGKGKIRA